MHTAPPAGAVAIGFHGRTPPWIATGDQAVIGFLFYYGEAPFVDGGYVPRYLAHATIATKGRLPHGNTKILWWVRKGRPGLSLTVVGKRLDDFGHFAQTIGGHGSTYPSIIKVPEAGC